MQFGDEFFGTPAQVALVRRMRDLRALIGNDPRFGTYGRNVVVLGDQGADMAPLTAAVSRLTGNCGSHYYPAERAEAMMAELAGAGFRRGRTGAAKSWP